MQDGAHFTATQMVRAGFYNYLEIKDCFCVQPVSMLYFISNIQEKIKKQNKIQSKSIFMSFCTDLRKKRGYFPIQN